MRRRLTITITLLGILIIIFLVFINTQYFLVYRANQNIDTAGIKLGLKENTVRGILGKEKEYIQGFGCYLLNYRDQGMVLTFLNDRDTGFYEKVNGIKITGSEYEIYGVKAGYDYNKALDQIKMKGFKVKKEVPGFWKKNLYIILNRSGTRVQSIEIGIRDKVASNRSY